MSKPDLAKPMSIRLREGDAEIIKRATGRPVGEIIRDMTASYAERIKLEQAMKAQSGGAE